jgi:hypothetical protein
MTGERVGLGAGRNLPLQHTVLPYRMDEQPPTKEMINVIDHCRGRRKQFVIGCGTSQCHIL